MTERGLLFSARLVGACTLLSRILGMIRDVLCAHYFGASAEWDAFVIAFVVPNLFRRLFGEGALTAAFVPVFVERLRKGDGASAGRLLRALVSILSLILLTFVVLGILASFALPRLSADPKMESVSRMLRIMLPYLYLICTTAILGAALNSLGHYLAPALAPVLLNVVWIGGFLLVAPEVEVQVIGVLVAGVLQLLLQIPPLVKRGFNPLPRFDRNEQGLRDIAILFFPAVFGLALVQINEVVDLVIAEVCVPGDGAVSVLNYANRLMQLPLAVIGTALATAAFPRLSAHAADADPSAFSQTIEQALRSCFFITLPATVGLGVLAMPIIELLFEHGAFGPGETKRTALTVLFYAIGISAYSANQILIRAFYATKDTRTPVRITAAMVAANLGLNLILVWPLREAGLALATAITGTATTFLLYQRLCRKVKGLRVRLGGHFFRCLFLALLMGGFVALGDLLLPGADATATIARALRLGALIGGGAGFYFGLTRVWKLLFRS